MEYNRRYQPHAGNLKAAELANAIFRDAHFDLNATAAESAEGCLLSIDGADNAPLLNQGGELLDALQQILNQALGRNPPKGQRIICDADNYRAAREESCAPWPSTLPGKFAPLPLLLFRSDGGKREARDYLTPADEADLHTESIGEGNARRLRVSPRSAQP